MKLRWGDPVKRGIWKAQGTRRLFTIQVADDGKFFVEEPYTCRDSLREAQMAAQQFEDVHADQGVVREGQVWGDERGPTGWRYVTDVYQNGTVVYRGIDCDGDQGTALPKFMEEIRNMRLVYDPQ